MENILRLLITLFFFNTIGHAQPYYFRHYQVENGLSNSTIFCSIQDKNGFMWFGTKDGLNRFDGYRFKTFNINLDDESSLTRDQISALEVDEKGVLWVGSQKGLFFFDEKKEKLISFIDTLPDINDLLIDKTGNLWFISGATVCRFDFRKKKLKFFDPKQFFYATSLCRLDDGSIWFSSQDGNLQRFEPATESFKAYDVFSHSPPPSSRWIAKILAGKDGSIYVGTLGQGLKEFSVASSEYKDLLTYNKDKTTVYVRDILKVSEKEFWFATESGIFILNTVTNKFTSLRKKYRDPYSLSDNAIYTLYKDSEGGIWAGTYFGGLNYYPKQFSSFQKYFPDHTKNSISGSAVREICQDGSGNIWIGTEDAGLNKLDIKSGEFTRYLPTGSPTSIAYSNIHGLLVVKNNLWIGTFQHGLDVLDIKTGEVIKHYSKGEGENDLKNDFIVSLLQTRSGDIYIGTGSLLYKYLPATNNFLLVPEVPQNIFVGCLMEDHNGNVWVGTHGSGIFYFNPVTKEKGEFKNEPHNKNSITTNTINALFEDSFQNFWFATEGGGLCKLSKDKKQLTRFTTKTGLPSNFVFKVLEDNKKNLWATTSKGLVSFTGNKNIFAIYTKENGLLNDQFNYNSGFRDTEGKLYFGSVRGMVTFKPDEFYQTKFIPPIFITGFQVHNKELEIDKDTSYLKQSILYTNEITLPHDRSSFSFDFAAVSFSSPEVIEYSYMMTGLDKDWTYLKPNRKVYFTNLEPGTYTFKIKAASNRIWSGEQTKLTIVILPPFWATWWAYLAYAILGISLLYYLVKTYHNMHMNKKEKEIYEAKIDFFTNIAHEIRTPLTLIKGPVENLSDMVDELPEIKDDVAMMQRNTGRLVNLVSQILDFRQVETKGFSLDFTEVNMNELLYETYLTFEPVAKKRELNYSIHMPSSRVYIMADDEALNKIFSNLFSNAVKYADEQVSIKLINPTKEVDFLAIEISNDGFMIPFEMKEKIFEPFYRLKETIKQKGTGIGLALARSLVELHHGKLFLKDSDEGMNIFVVQLPYAVSRNKKRNFAEQIQRSENQ